jgi:hypothetical protein
MRVLIEPVHGSTTDLATMIDAITDENRHDAVDSGPPQGNEAWRGRLPACQERAPEIPRPPPGETL